MITVTEFQLEGVRKIYIGRGTPLGNPFTHVAWFARGRPWMTVVPTREESVYAYEIYIRALLAQKDPEVCAMFNRLWKLATTGDLQLICHCKPLACHGDVVKRVIEERL